MNNTLNIANFIFLRLQDERPEFIKSIGKVSFQEDDDGNVQYALAVTDKDRMYKITVESL